VYETSCRHNAISPLSLYVTLWSVLFLNLAFKYSAFLCVPWSFTVTGTLRMWIVRTIAGVFKSGEGGCTDPNLCSNAFFAQSLILHTTFPTP